jgi:isocitrate dehydrogenase kinase/phosphatase
VSDDAVRAVALPTILAAFADSRDRFGALTARARARFAARDWQGMQADTVARLEVHAAAVTAAAAELRHALGDAAGERRLWMRAKQEWAAAILGRPDRELAQTFFNSVSRRFVARRGVDPALDFLPYDFAGAWSEPAGDVVRGYAGPAVSAALVERLLGDLVLGAPFRDLRSDAAATAARLDAALGAALGDGRIDRLEVLAAPFYRNKAAYVVGRVLRDGAVRAPVLLALLHGPRGVEVDAVLASEDEVSVVFSFARWYFLVDADPPRAVVGFLRSILPRKRIAELYIALGHHKHGKTEYFADFSHQIQESREQLVRAPGKEGLVMKVFHLPDYEFVFKVIKDHFPAAKRVTRSQVKANYRLVLTHDRVGRLIDFQEFEHLTFPRARFAPQFLAELHVDAGGQLHEEGGDVLVRHLYVGRRVVPLDLFLASDVSTAEKEAAVSDWGWCLRDLAAGNVFAGDLLLKNFGVTRHGRVVFYDYDELAPLDALRFRRLPPTRDDLAELQPEPWFGVADEDVFPEEFPRFLELTGHLRQRFVAEHGCLFDPAWWIDMQRRNREGELVDVFPYPESRRLRPSESEGPAGLASARGRVGLSAEGDS